MKLQIQFLFKKDISFKSLFIYNTLVCAKFPEDETWLYTNVSFIRLKWTIPAFYYRSSQCQEEEDSTSDEEDWATVQDAIHTNIQ